jgi:multidrug efflux system membrane fusion protein
MKRFFSAKPSIFIALGVLLALAGWLLSGQLQNNAKPVDSTATPREQSDALTRVRVRDFQAQPISQEIVITGRTEPAREVTLRAEIDARVMAIEAERGAAVKEGDIIVRLDLRDRRARLREAQAQVKQRELQYRAAQRLFADKHQSETQIAEARANLENARAQLEQIETEIDDAIVRAPFDGILEERPVEKGDYVSVGDTVARIIEQNPLVISGDIPQQDVHRVKIGAPGSARLVTGQEVQGRIRYISAQADEATRTFRVELEVPNPDNRLVAGVTSEIHLPMEQLTAHYLPMGILSLNDAGQVGVKSVNGDNQVEFYPVPILRTTTGGVWVGELPETVRIITVGQGFVHSGQEVEPVAEKAVAEAKPPRDGDPS